jgi:hypothetical protein
VTTAINRRDINRHNVNRSPLTEAALTFRLLTSPPFPLGLHGASFDPAVGMPARFLPLPRIDRLLRREQCNQPLRRAVWQTIVARAQDGDPAWRVAAVHLAARQISRRARLLAAREHCITWTAQAEVIVGLLRSIDTGTAVDTDWLA